MDENLQDKLSDHDSKTLHSLPRYAEYLDANNKVCITCASSCDGCTGPTGMDCERCAEGFNKKYIDDSRYIIMLLPQGLLLRSSFHVIHVPVLHPGLNNIIIFQEWEVFFFQTKNQND